MTGSATAAWGLGGLESLDCHSWPPLTPTPGLEMRGTWLQEVIWKNDVVAKASSLGSGPTWV